MRGAHPPAGGWAFSRSDGDACRVALDIFLKGEFETKPDGARLQRGDLVGAGCDGDAEGEAIADFVGEVGNGQRECPAFVGNRMTRPESIYWPCSSPR